MTEARLFCQRTDLANESYKIQAITLRELCSEQHRLEATYEHSVTPIITIVPSGVTGVLVGRLEREKVNSS